MSHVQIFDRALCCSTGVCGPQTDPELPKFASDLQWLSEQGHQVDRFNLAHDPGQFADNATVQRMLADQGTECLPLIMVDGDVVSRGKYPVREELAVWTGTTTAKASSPLGGSLPMADSGGCCGGETDCC